MSDQRPQGRTIPAVRAEIATTRRLLDENVAALKEEARSALPVAAGSLAGLLVLTKGRGALHAYRFLRLLR